MATRRPPSKIAAVILDMDGLMLDTETPVQLCCEQAAAAIATKPGLQELLTMLETFNLKTAVATPHMRKRPRPTCARQEFVSAFRLW